MDRRLGEVAHLAGEDYSIADVATWPWVSRFEWHGLDHGLDDFPNVKRWYDAIAARPGGRSAATTCPRRATRSRAGVSRLRASGRAPGPGGAAPSKGSRAAGDRARGDRAQRRRTPPRRSASRSARSSSRSLFTIDGAPVMALVAGDRRCDTRALPGAFGRSGLVLRADADRVREVTGFAIGGVRAARPSARRCRPRSTTASAASRRSTPRPATRTACSRPPCWSSAC